MARTASSRSPGRPRFTSQSGQTAGYAPTTRKSGSAPRFLCATPAGNTTPSPALTSNTFPFGPPNFRRAAPWAPRAPRVPCCGNGGTRTPHFATPHASRVAERDARMPEPAPSRPPGPPLTGEERTDADCWERCRRRETERDGPPAPEERRPELPESS